MLIKVRLFLWTISRRSITGLFGSNGIEKFDPIVLRNIVIVGAPGPMINVRAHIASYWAIICFTARDPMIVIVEAELASRSVAKILRLHRLRIGPQA